MWAYRFTERLPPHLQLRLVVQKTKGSKRIDAEQARPLSAWYDKLKQVTENLVPRPLYSPLYNFDECSFQSGKGKDQKVTISTQNCYNVASAEHTENITIVECIAVDGWFMDPFYIFKGTPGTLQEDWFHESKALSTNTIVGASPNSWISNELAIA